MRIGVSTMAMLFVWLLGKVIILWVRLFSNINFCFLVFFSQLWTSRNRVEIMLMDYENTRDHTYFKFQDLLTAL